MVTLISTGRKLAAEDPKEAGAEAFIGRVNEWYDSTAEWLDKNIGGPAAYDFHVAVNATRRHAWNSDFWDRYRVARRQDIESQIRVLESIARHLPDWAQSAASSSVGHARQPARATRRPTKGAKQSTHSLGDKTIMVIYGHDQDANTALFAWLHMIGLEPQEWSQLIKATGSATPYNGQVLGKAFGSIKAVVALYTADEQIRGTDVRAGADSTWRLQARPNVLVEIGMALITHPDHLIIILLGPPELSLPSDLDGRHYIRLDGTPERLNEIATYLENSGCPVNRDGNRWLNPNIFPNRKET